MLADLGNAEDYAGLTAEYLLHEMQKDRTLVGITAGTPTAVSYTHLDVYKRQIQSMN